jgi:hypothetical protein
VNDASGKNAFAYDECTSARSLYNYFRDYDPAIGSKSEKLRGDTATAASPLFLMRCPPKGLRGRSGYVPLTTIWFLTAFTPSTFEATCAAF